MQLPMPGLAPGQNFWPAPQVQVLATQVAPPPHWVAASSQQPALPLDLKPQTPAIEQVRAWQALPIGHSLPSQQPVLGTQRPPPGAPPPQNLLPPPQPQMLLLQLAVPPQSALTLQQGAVSGCLAVYVHDALLQVAAF
jgi:hypothetical protein